MQHRNWSIASAAVLGCAAASMADVGFVQSFSQVRWSGVIGVGGDGVSWNQVDSYGWIVPPDPVMNGGISDPVVYYNDDDQGGGTWWGRTTTLVQSRGGYYVNGTLGVAARFEVGCRTENASSGPPTIMSSFSGADYKLRINVTAPAAFRLKGVGDFVGVFNMLKFSREGDGAIAFWTLFSPDGEQAFDVSGTLDTGTWLLECYQAANMGTFGVSESTTHATLVVGSVVGGGCNVADIAEVGGTAESPGSPDQQLTLDDLLVFINLFGEGTGCADEVVATPCSRADVCGIGGPPWPPDGQLTLDDLLAFVNAFGEGC